jgi:hypothetical protein
MTLETARAAPRDAEGGPREFAMRGGLRISDSATQIKKQVSSPELRKHLRAIEASNRTYRLWMEDERFDEIVSLCDIADSHLVSAHEAGFRRDRSLLGDHLRRARDGLRLAIQTFNMLPVDGGRT